MMNLAAQKLGKFYVPILFLSALASAGSSAFAQQTEFTDLPDELILKIFLEGDFSDWIECAQVCQNWERITCDSTLWPKRLMEMNEAQLIQLHRVASEKRTSQSKLDLLVKSIQSKLDKIPAEITHTGATFKRVYLGYDLGHGWKGPIFDGKAHKSLIWFDPATEENGTIRKMNHEDAATFCSTRGARLPSPKEWNQLKKSMSVRNSHGVQLGYTPLESLQLNYEFWTSNIDAVDDSFGNTFDGESGHFDYDNRYRPNAVRCVREIGFSTGEKNEISVNKDRMDFSST
jgi:hypothetical protein